MDISTNLALTIIICVTIICVTVIVIMQQVMKYLINPNKAKQKISDMNTKTIKKFTSFKYPWIYKETTTTNNPSNNELANNKSVNNESINKVNNESK